MDIHANNLERWQSLETLRSRFQIMQPVREPMPRTRSLRIQATSFCSSTRPWRVTIRIPPRHTQRLILWKRFEERVAPVCDDLPQTVAPAADYDS